MADDDSAFDEFPEIKKVFGIFPLKYGSFLIGIYGFSAGVAGLLGVALYGLGVFDVILHFFGTIDPTAKKYGVAVVGLVCLFMFLEGAALVIGVMFRSVALVTLFVFLSLICITSILAGFVAVPTLCFFDKGRPCLLDVYSPITLALTVLFFAVYLCSWTYFMIAVNSYRMQITGAASA